MIRISFILSILFASGTCFGQDLFVSGRIESTVIQYEYGGTLGYLSAKGLLLGAFYQEGISHSELSTETKNKYYGIETVVPIIRCEKMQFGAGLRIALANKNFIVVLPAVETMIPLNRIAGVATGLSWRSGRPAIYGKLFVKI